jgi:hypothetical protein
VKASLREAAAETTSGPEDAEDDVLVLLPLSLLPQPARASNNSRYATGVPLMASSYQTV